MSKQKIFSIMRNKFLILFILMLSSFYLTACGAPSAPATTGTGSSTGTGTTGATFTVGGTVTGLNLGQSITLQNNSGDDLTVSANGLFTFATPLNDNSTYNVSIPTQPAGQTCTVLNNSGTVNSSNITDVAVSCVTNPNKYAVSGTISGMDSGKSVILQNNSGDDITVNTNGLFKFLTPLAVNSTYNVSVLTQPVGQICTVANGSGTIVDSNITDVTVSCVANTTQFTLGGNVADLDTGKSIILQNNSGDNLTVSAKGLFTFATPLNDNSTYNVSVLTQPVGQTCSVLNNSGTISSSDIKDVGVSCIDTTIAKPYSVSGTVKGLIDLSDSVALKIADGSGNVLGSITVNYNSTYATATPVSPVPFTFPISFANGAQYSVAVDNASNGKTCTIYNNSGSGTINSSNVVNVYVVCQP